MFGNDSKRLKTAIHRRGRKGIQNIDIKNVVTGVIISALVFAWQHAKHINVRTYLDDKGRKI